MNKILKITGIVTISIVVLIIAALAVLRWMFPDQRLKQMAIDYAKNNFHREISFDKISFGFVGVTLDNFAISEESTFEQGTFIQAKELSVNLALLPLLKKHIKIDSIRIQDLQVTIVKNADETFNFDSLTTPTNEQTTDSSEKNSSLGFALTAKQFVAKNCNFIYKDVASSMTTSVNNISFDIRNFDLSNPFQAVISFTTQIKQKNQADITLPAKLDLTIFLANLNLPQAYVTLNQATASYKTVQLMLQGKVENFQNLDINIMGTLNGISNEIFTDFLPDLPAFKLPTISLSLVAQADLDKSIAQLTKAAIELKDSSISMSGPVDWGGEAATYTLEGKTYINLEQAIEMTDLTQVRPTGSISGSFKMTDKRDYQDISGTWQLKDVSIIYPPFTLTQTNGTIKMASLENISSNNLAGLLNGEKLTLSFSYKQAKQVANCIINADLAKLKLDSFPGANNSETSTQTSAAENQAEQKTSTTDNAETLFNLKTNLKIGAVSIPYMRSDGFTLQTDLTGLSSSMNKANGTISFSLQPGAITDIDTLLKGNKIVRFLLLPFGIINSVAKKLHISLFESTASAGKGEIAFSKGEGDYVFKNGLMTINNTSFISDLTNIKGSGTIDFPTNKLDMKVSATLLTKQTPMVIKIGGTLDDPSGKLDVLNTVGSVVGGLLNYKTATGLASGTVKTAGNVAGGAAKTTKQTTQAALKGTANAAKKTVNAIGNLVKKKSQEEPEEKN